MAFDVVVFVALCMVAAIVMSAMCVVLSLFICFVEFYLFAQEAQARSPQRARHRSSPPRGADTEIANLKQRIARVILEMCLFNVDHAFVGTRH